MSDGPISTGVPDSELGNDGRIGAALGGLLARREERDSKGRFIHENTGHLHTLEHSAQLLAALEPLKQEMVMRVRVQLAADTDDAPETLLGVIDGYVEARLLRSSAFVRLSQLGGFMTSKGKARALLGTWRARWRWRARAHTLRSGVSIGRTSDARDKQDRHGRVSQSEWCADQGFRFSQSLGRWPEASGLSEQADSRLQEDGRAESRSGRCPGDSSDEVNRSQDALDV
jgi:hypothetical protein